MSRFVPETHNDTGTFRDLAESHNDNDFDGDVRTIILFRANVEMSWNNAEDVGNHRRVPFG